MRAIADFEISPLKAYGVPKYPTHERAWADSDLLKKLPSRWMKNLGALACVSLLGVSVALGGCIPARGNGNGENGHGNGNHQTENGNGNGNGSGNNGNGNHNWADIDFDTLQPSGGGPHFGGSGTPLYVVYFTEQEAIDIIRNRANHFGLLMNDTPPDVSVTVKPDEDFGSGNYQREIKPALFNKENNVALSYVGGISSTWWWSNREIAEDAKKAFDALDGDLTAGVFHGRVESFHNQNDFFGDHAPSPEERAQAGEKLKEHLTTQVREFIEWLQAEGIIQ